jgi:hypothetical protein
MFMLSLLFMLLPLLVAAIRRIAYDAELLARTPQAIYEMFKHERFTVYESVIRLRYILIAIIIATCVDLQSQAHASKLHAHASDQGLLWALAAIGLFWLLPIGLYVARAIRWGAFAAEPLRFASVPVRVSWALVPATIATLAIAPLRKIAFAHDPALSHHGHAFFVPPGVAGVAEIAIPIAAAIFIVAAIAIKIVEGVSPRSLLQRTPYKKGSVDHLMDDLMRDLRDKSKVG